MENINVETAQQFINLVSIVVLALIALFTVGFGGFILIIRQNRDMVEKLYLSASPETQALIRDIVKYAKELATVADEVTDGQPNSELPGAPGTGG